jgi:hypothetical protein
VKTSRLAILALAACIAIGGAAAMTPARAQTPAPGTVLLKDSLAEAASGVFPAGSRSGGKTAYVDGEFQMALSERADIVGVIPLMASDASLEYDARLVGDPTGQHIAAFCRARPGDGGLSGYEWMIWPWTGTQALFRLDQGQVLTLVPSTRAAGLLGDNRSYHFQLTCAGDTIAMSINGTNLATVHDSQYRDGQFAMIAGTGDAQTMDARFRNLVITAASAPQAGPTAPAGTVLKSDNFTDPATGILPLATASPKDWDLGYVDGEYRIAKVNPTAGPPGATVGSFGDSTVAVDARLLGDPTGKFVQMSCRRSGNPSTIGDYTLTVSPFDGSFDLRRFNPDGSHVDLAPQQPSTVIRLGNETNHIELTCAGSTIAASINGTQVASVTDDTYKAGATTVGTGVFANFPRVAVEMRLKSLVVTQR